MRLTDITFTGEDAELYTNMLQEFISFGRKALTMNHYDFAECSEITDPQLWKAFLQIDEVAEYIQEEFNAVQDSELRKLIMNISDSSSVGKAQLINAMQKQLNEHASDKKTGPAFIYTYVPLNAQERTADNVVMLDDDPFLVETPIENIEEELEEEGETDGPPHIPTRRHQQDASE